MSFLERSERRLLAFQGYRDPATAIIGGSVISGAMGSKSASKAARATTAASQASIEEQRRQYDLIRGDTAKYRDVGGNALYSLADMMGVSYENPYDQQISDLEGQLKSPEAHKIANALKGKSGVLGRFGNKIKQAASINDPEVSAQIDALRRKQSEFNNREKYDFTESPGYEFRLDEGYKGIERSQAGRRLSGRALKESMRYGQDYASNEFGAQFGRLSTLAGFGPAGVNTTAAANPANAISNAYANQGAGQANAAYQSGQAVNNAVQGGLENWYSYNQASSYDPSQGSSYYDPSRAAPEFR